MSLEVSIHLWNHHQNLCHKISIASRRFLLPPVFIIIVTIFIRLPEIIPLGKFLSIQYIIEMDMGWSFKLGMGPSSPSYTLDRQGNWGSGQRVLSPVKFRFLVAEPRLSPGLWVYTQCCSPSSAAPLWPGSAQPGEGARDHFLSSGPCPPAHLPTCPTLSLRLLWCSYSHVCLAQTARGWLDVIALPRASYLLNRISSR